MRTIDPQEGGPGACPKRRWVMSTLADDEAMNLDGSIPQGLGFHLSRCKSCKVLADQVQSVVGLLRGLSEAEPGERLIYRANQQTEAALAAGAPLTGRVVIPEAVDLTLSPGAASRRFPIARFAAAAVIVLVVGVYALLATSGPLNPGESPSKRLALHPVLPIDEPTQARGAVDVVGQQTEVTSAPVGGIDDPSAGDPAKLPVGNLADAVVRGGGVDEPVQDRPTACHHRTRMEAAMCDNPHSVHTAIVLPKRAQQALRFNGRAFDKAPRPASNGSRPGGR